MKKSRTSSPTFLILITSILTAWLPGTAMAASLTSGFTYQGRLLKNGSPVTGTCDFQFSLWDSAGSGNPPSGGSAIGATQTLTNVSVSNGLFNVVLNAGNQLGAGVLNNSQRRFLMIAVRNPAGSGAYTTLSPRQELTAAPYAQNLKGGAVIRNDGPAGASSSGLYVESINGDGLTATANLAAKAGLFAQHNNGGNGVNGATTSNAASGTAGVAGVNNGAGAGVRGLSATGAGVEGISNAASPGGYGVYGHSANQVGVWGDSLNQIGVQGSSKNETGVSGASQNAAGVYGSSDIHHGVVGRTSWPASYGVRGENTAGGGGVYGTANNTADVTKAGVVGNNDGTGFGVAGKSQGGSGVMGSGTAAGIGVIGRAGAGVSAPVFSSGIGAWGDSSAGPGLFGSSSNGSGVYAQSAGGAPALRANNTNSNQQNLIECMYNGTNKFWVSYQGYLTCGMLQVTTVDLAEHVPARGDKPQPGDVVEIDPDNDENFRLAATANSTLVAGVISTAPGMVLGATNETQDQPKLALAGRVPVKVCDEGGAIRRGDLLAASSTPGRAMRAPAAPAPGTIVGKALEPLDQGLGTINMLVMLH